MTASAAAAGMAATVWIAFRLMGALVPFAYM